MVQMAEAMRSMIDPVAARREWSKLPSSFELDAVRHTFARIKPHFTRAEIKQRIAASKATTFVELYESIA